jgi:hypothetical protein
MEWLSLTTHQGQVPDQVLMYELLKALAEKSQKSFEIRMCVFQIKPGHRYRVPILGPRGCSDDAKIIFQEESFARPVSAKEKLEELRRRWAEVGEEAGVLSADPHEHCAQCSTSFKNGDITIAFEGPVHLCEKCGVARGGSPIGLSVFVLGSSREDANENLVYWLQKSARRIPSVAKQFGMTLRKTNTDRQGSS